MMSHDEVFSIGDYFSLRVGGKCTYRPTVMFVYHPCDDAMLSVLELEGRGWQPQERLDVDLPWQWQNVRSRQWRG